LIQQKGCRYSSDDLLPRFIDHFQGSNTQHYTSICAYIHFFTGINFHLPHPTVCRRHNPIQFFISPDPLCVHPDSHSLLQRLPFRWGKAAGEWSSPVACAYYRDKESLVMYLRSSLHLLCSVFRKGDAFYFVQQYVQYCVSSHTVKL
jgi:hypothetical protein